MTKDELSLLLYFETLAVDHRGVVDPARINADDIAIAQRWDKTGFCAFKRFTDRHVKTGAIKALTHLVTLSGEAWVAAHTERRARAQRMASERSRPPRCLSPRWSR